MCRHLAKPSIRAVLLVGGSAPKQARQELAAGVDIVTGTQGKYADATYVIAQHDTPCRTLTVKCCYSQSANIPVPKPRARTLHLQAPCNKVINV